MKPAQDLLAAITDRSALTESRIKSAPAVLVVTDHDDVDYELVASHALLVQGMLCWLWIRETS